MLLGALEDVTLDSTTIPPLLLLHTTILLPFSPSSAVALVSLRVSSSLSSRLRSWLSSCRCWRLAFVLSNLFSVACSCLARLSRQERVSRSNPCRTRASLLCLVRIWEHGWRNIRRKIQFLPKRENAWFMHIKAFQFLRMRAHQRPCFCGNYSNPTEQWYQRDKTNQPTCERLPSESWKCCSAIVWRCWSLFSSLFSVLASVSCCCRSHTWLFSSLMQLKWADWILVFEACRDLIGGSFRTWRLAVQFVFCLWGPCAFLSEEEGKQLHPTRYITYKHKFYSTGIKSCWMKCLFSSFLALVLATCLMNCGPGSCRWASQLGLQSQRCSVNCWSHSPVWGERTTSRCRCCSWQRPRHPPSWEQRPAASGSPASRTSLLHRLLRSDKRKRIWGKDGY